MNEFFKNILSITLVLFAVIDIIGSLPIIIDIKSKSGHISAIRTTLIAFGLMIAFLFLGESLLGIIGLDIQSFALAGSVVIFILSLEMILGVSIMKVDADPTSNTVVPLAFPIIAGAGTLTTILSLKAEFQTAEISAGILINAIIIFIVLQIVPFLEKILGQGGLAILRRIFGIILLAIAIKLFKANLFI